MKQIEKIRTNFLIQVNFHEKNQTIIDIQHLFDISIESYKKLFSDFGLQVSYNFKNNTNKRFFMNELVKNYIHLLKDNPYRISFYRCGIIPNEFQNRFIKKMKSIFNISILDGDMDLATLVYFYEKKYSEQVELIDQFFTVMNSKKFKKIKNYLEKEGMFYLYEECINNLTNKMHILIK